MPNREKRESLPIQELNNKVLEVVEHYKRLKLFGLEVTCTYYINKPVQYFIDLMRKSGIGEDDISRFYQLYKENQSQYGWYQGKGTPEEIEGAVKYFLPKADTGNLFVTPQGIRDAMGLRGVGVDCSGFVFNSLHIGFKKLGLHNDLIKSIKWPGIYKQNVYQASVQVLASSSQLISDPNELKPLDLLVENPGHIGIFLNDIDRQLKLYQSTPWATPNGINTSNIKVEGDNVHFSFIPSLGDDWNDLYRKGKIEFRRLNMLS
jgi:hypothetical protein